MAKELPPRASSHLVKTNFDAFTPLASQSLFWRAQYVKPSPTLNALPLLFWVVESARPRVCVTLGVEDAVPYFALCQAIEKLDLETMCFGINAPGEEGQDLAPILAHNEQHYADFSEISVNRHAEAADLLDEAEIDFLVIRDPITQALQDELDEHWLPRMSEQGVILFLGGGERIIRYVTQLAQNSGRFMLDTTNGIGLALSGTEHNERLRRLCQLKVGKPGYLAVRNIFLRVGELHSTAVEIDSLTAQGVSDRAQHTKLTTEADVLRSTLAEKKQLAETLNTQLKVKSRQITVVQAEIFDIKAEGEANAQKAAALTDQLTASKAQTAEAQKTVAAEREVNAQKAAALTEQLTASKAQTAEAQNVAAERVTDIASLGLRIGALDQELADAKEAAANLTADLQAATATTKETAQALVDEQNKTKALTADVQTAQARTSQHEVDLKERYDDISALGHELTVMQQQLQRQQSLESVTDEMNNKLTLLRAESDAKSRDLAEARQHLEDIRHERDAAQTRVTELENSNSWRITSPLRKISQSTRTNK